jgi:hypothetical protein
MAGNLFSVTTVNSNYPATLVVAASPNQGVLLYNSDPQVTIWLGDNNAFQAGDPNHGTSLSPLSSVTFDGTQDVYASCTAGQTALLKIYPTGGAYSQGQSLQPLVQAGSVGGSPAAVIPAGGGEGIISLLDMSSYASYDMNLYLIASSPSLAGSVVTAQCQIQWFDDLVSGVPVFEEDWWFWAARMVPSGINSMAAAGPVHGRYMSVTIFLPVTSLYSATLQYINLFGSFRNLPYSDWRQNVLGVEPECTPLSYLSGQGSSFDNTLVSLDQGNIGASGKVWIPCGLYSGPAYYHIRLSATPIAVPVIVNCQNTVGGGLVVGTACPGLLVAVAGAAGTDYFGNLFLPRAPCALIVEGNASASTITFALIAQQSA